MKKFAGKITLLLFVLFFIFAAKAQADSFDVISYDAKIQPDISKKTVSGKVSLRFISLAENLTKIQLGAGNLEVDAVRENDSALKYERREKFLNVTLSRPAKLNESREIEIEYHGTPRSGIRFYPAQSQIYTVFSTSQWMPCVDAPEDRATFRLNLIVPKDLQVVGNGRFAGQTELPDDKISSRWEQTLPVPTYTFGFAAGRFRSAAENHSGVKFRYLSSPDFSEKQLLRIFRETAKIFDFYESKAGVKYSDEAYTQVLPVGSAEQEMSGFTVLTENYGREVLADEKAVWLAAHELAHQWWGNTVTNKNWNHFWLNEGIANFMTAAFYESRFGRKAYLAEIENSRREYEKVRGAGKDKPLVFPDWNRPTGDDRTLVYDKGAYVVYLLREQLGDAAFWKGFKEYTRKFRGKSVTTEDFQAAMEESSGRDLSAFFDKWIYPVKPKAN